MDLRGAWNGIALAHGPLSLYIYDCFFVVGTAVVVVVVAVTFPSSSRRCPRRRWCGRWRRWWGEPRWKSWEDKNFPDPKKGWKAWRPEVLQRPVKKFIFLLSIKLRYNSRFYCVSLIGISKFSKYFLIFSFDNYSNIRCKLYQRKIQRALLRL